MTFSLVSPQFDENGFALCDSVVIETIGGINGLVRCHKQRCVNFVDLVLRSSDLGFQQIDEKILLFSGDFDFHGFPLYR